MGELRSDGGGKSGEFERDDPLCDDPLFECDDPLFDRDDPLFERDDPLGGSEPPGCRGDDCRVCPECCERMCFVSPPWLLNDRWQLERNGQGSRRGLCRRRCPLRGIN